jgi:uncharacterized integral membrane protein
VTESPGQSPSPPPEPAHTPSRRITGREVVVGVLAVLVIVFVAENTHKVGIRFIGPKVSTPIFVALLVTLAIGIAIGWLLGRRGKQRESRRSRQRNS